MLRANRRYFPLNGERGGILLDRPLLEVMLSSTFRDLVSHRAHFDRVLKQHRLHAIQMEDDATLSDQDMIDASLAKVDAAQAYACLIGKRYGQIRTCATRNPQELSLTELEFERALSRGIPIAVLLMGPDYLVADRNNEFDPGKREKLQAFRERVGLPHRVVAQFESWEQFLELVPVAVRDLRDALDKRMNKGPSDAESRPSKSSGADDIVPPCPPAYHIVKPFTQGHKFVGRVRELERIGRWALGPEPLLLFEAIGGMGKSMVTFRWTDQLAETVRPDWAGRLWYSFYEEGASMNDFCVHALGYFENHPPSHFRGTSTADLEPIILQHLQSKPYLIVMDGLERALAVYNRYDKAQMTDSEAVRDPIDPDADPFRCIRPADDHLLRSLTTVRPSKLLVSTRNMPTALLNASGKPIAGVDHERLAGLAPEDAEKMLRDSGVSGDSGRIRQYLDTHFNCHPLMVGVVAGMVNTYLSAPGSFDRWLKDPRGAGAVNVAKLEGLERKRTHILQVAYGALDADQRYLLGTLAFFSQSVPGDVLVELNPKRPSRPNAVPVPVELDEVSDAELRWLTNRLETATDANRSRLTQQIARRKHEFEERFAAKLREYKDYRHALSQWQASAEVRDADAWLGRAVLDLQKRGLVISDHLTAQYDLHPMVRGFVRQGLKGEESARMGTVVADFAQSRLEPKYQSAASLTDLAQGIQIVTALTLGGHFERAANALIHTELSNALFRLELHADRLALLQPFFGQGWNSLPNRVPRPETQRALAAEAAVDLGALERYAEAETLLRLMILSAVAEKKLGPTSWYVNTLAFILGKRGQIYRRAQLLKIHRRIAEVLDDDEELVDNRLRQGWMEFSRGNVEAARGHTNWIQEAKSDPPGVQNVDSIELINLTLSIKQKRHDISEADIMKMMTLSIKEGSVFGRRMAWLHLADYFQNLGDHKKAVEAFEEHIALCRSGNFPEGDPEASYAKSLLALGRVAEANEIAAGIQEPNASLAEFHLAAGNISQARETALAGFQKAWGDGPPYALHWDLQAYREVLAAISEPEPPLPPFKPDAFEPFEFEPDLLRLIAESEVKSKTKAGTASNDI